MFVEYIRRQYVLVLTACTGMWQAGGCNVKCQQLFAWDDSRPGGDCVV